MILLLLVVVVSVAAAGAGLLGVGILSGDQRRERTGFLAMLSAPVVLVAGVALLALLVFGLGGSPSETTAPERPRAQPAEPLPDARLGEVSADIPVVVIEATDEDGFAPYRPVSGLVPGAAVRVQAEGFDRFERGSVAQCVVELGRRTACGDAFPVQFDDAGRADFQVAVRGEIAPGGCRLAQATCMLRLSGRSSGREGSVQTVLVDSIRPGVVRVEPAGALADGQRVEVEVAGFPPGTTASAVLCAPPDAYDARRCGPPTPGSSFSIDAGGAGRASLTVSAGRLGSEAALCGPRRVCGVAVVVGPGFVVAPVAPVRFAMGPGVAYDAGRLAAGLLIAVGLVGAAVAIAVRTDWTKPTEAATPALDGSDLRTGQSLDDLFGTDEELDERDPILW